MLIKEIMTPNFETIPVDASLSEAAKKMKALDIGVIPVEEQDHSIAGVITDRDIVVRGIAGKKDPNKTKVKEVMSRDLITCPENADVQQAVHTMEEKRVRRLLITDKSGRPAGIISIGDIATHSDSLELGGEVLKMVSEHGHPVH